MIVNRTRFFLACIPVKGEYDTYISGAVYANRIFEFGNSLVYNISMNKKSRFIFISIFLVISLLFILGLTKSTLGKQLIDGSGRYYEGPFGVYYLTSYFPSECTGGSYLCFTEWVPIVKRITNADKDTFSNVEGNHIYQLFKDKNGVYYNGVLLDYLDSESIQYIGNTVFTDKNGVYSAQNDPSDGRLLLRRIEGADSETFVFLSKSYAKDKNNVYYIEVPGSGWRRPFIIGDADLETFQIFKAAVYDEIETKFAKDKNKVYYYGAFIEGADPFTFAVIENSKRAKDVNAAKDQHHVYHLDDKRATIAEDCALDPICRTYLLR